MADCKQKEWLAPYHDGELPPERRRELEEHLAGCPHCARELERLQGLSGLLATAQAPAVPEGMVSRLHEALDGAREYGIIRLCRAVSLAAAALLIVCGSWLLSGAPNGSAPAGPLANWELVAVALDAELAQAGAEEATALWVVSDLSRENGL